MHWLMTQERLGNLTWEPTNYDALYCLLGEPSTGAV